MRRGLRPLSGNDDVALAFLALGGAGTISVTANVAPRLFAQMHDAHRDGDHARALEIQDRLFPLHKALFSDASPGPVKYALSRVRPGFPLELRLPMTAGRCEPPRGGRGARTAGWCDADAVDTGHRSKALSRWRERVG